MSADDVSWLVEFLRRVVPRGVDEEERLVDLIGKLGAPVPQ